MSKKKPHVSVVILFLLLFFSISIAFQKSGTEKGTLSVYFMEERVGYEEYVWEVDERGFTLTVKGKMTKPIPMEIETLMIRLDRDFIPYQFFFRGSVSGLDQEISSSIADGHVESTIQVAGQEQKSTAQIRRDAFLLPNPIFSPYLVLTKKYNCSLEEKVELAAYIIPQLETPFSLEPDEDNSCYLLMDMGGVEIELNTDIQGRMTFLHIPSRKLQVFLEGSVE
jgi:hypothetical protein